MVTLKEEMIDFISHAFKDLRQEYDLADSPSKVTISREIRTLYDLLDSSDTSELLAKRMSYDLSKLMRTLTDDERLLIDIRDEYVEKLRMIG